MRTLCAIMILINLIMGESYMPSLNSIDKYFEIAHSITVYTNGKTTDLKPGENTYNDIVEILNNICDGSREMPAYGVSLDNETKNEIRNGYWLEFRYNNTQTHNEMPFDTLLINVKKDYQGFDIIRGQKGIYEGRCFHIYCPQKTMENLYNYLQLL